MPEGFGGHIALEAWRGETDLSLKYMGPDGLVFQLDGFRPAKVELGGMGSGGKWQVSHANSMDEVTADASGNLSLNLPAKAAVTVNRIN